MHPAVETRNLQRLPAAHRRVALAACGTSPSFQDFRRVEMQVEGAPAHQKILYLPVFYIALDTARIPMPHELESLQPHITTRIACASVSLKTTIALLVNSKSAGEIGPTVWPRVWPWIYFMHEHREYLPDPIVLADLVMYNHFIVFATQMQATPGDLISSTPGFRVILAKVWSTLPQLKGSKVMLETSLRDVAAFIGNLDFMDPVHFTEIIDGAGGTLDDLAGLVLSYLDALMDEQLSWEIGSPAVYVRCLVRFIQRGYSPNRDESPSSFRDLPRRQRFIETLRQRELATSLVAVMDFLLGRKSDTLTESGCGAIFDLLERLFNTPRGYLWLPRAIQAGLLRTMTTVAIQCGPDFDYYVRYVLKTLLSDGTVYYHVVEALNLVLPEIKNICSREHFQTLATFNDWAQFIELVEQRVSLIKQMKVERIKACDNLVCGRIEDSTLYQRCSGCRSFYYCNRECQVMDWSWGGHRNHCGSYTTLSLGTFHRPRLIIIDCKFDSGIPIVSVGLPRTTVSSSAHGSGLPARNALNI
ncbi:hypothetical protein K438DRAFT_1831609 [Mycena galopus ATCC 62051]|nr:hypothetical protein K438DRAFT_1831609 [Mycena galopus ATCC 62051]